MNINEQLAAAAKSAAEETVNYIHDTYNGWSEKWIAEIITKHFTPLVQRLEQEEQDKEKYASWYIDQRDARIEITKERDSLLAKVKELEERNLKLVDYMSNHSR